MTIIDEIYDIEAKIEHLKKIGEQEIVEIQDKSKKQQQVMQDTFAEEYKKDIQELEQKMTERVEEYTQKRQTSCNDERNQLENAYQQKKEIVIQKVCHLFWQE